MKIIKSDLAALSYRCRREGHQNCLDIGMMSAFSFSASSAPTVLTEVELWKAAAKALGPRACLDEGFAKPCAEFLVYGSAWAASGQLTGDMLVAVQVGGLRKTLAVSGNRYFNAFGLISNPAPFVSMPIDRSTAFGGAAYAPNSLGKGFEAARGSDGASTFPLPNVERTTELVTRQGQTPQPAGFWGSEALEPQRAQHLGPFGKAWVANTWPHLPPATAKDYFSVAPKDQRLTGFWRGDEAIEIDNMHPDQARIRTALPALRARCFINLRVGDSENFTELPAYAETVWLFPELECGIVLYRATADIASDDADDVAHIVAEWEPMSQPPHAVAYYQQKLQGEPAGGGSAGGGVGNISGSATRTGENAQATPAADPAGAPAAAAASAPDSAAAVRATPESSLAEASQVAEASADNTAEKSSVKSAELHEMERHSAEFERHVEQVMRESGLTQEDLAPYLGNDQDDEALLWHKDAKQDIDALAADLDTRTRAFMQTEGLTDADLNAAMAEADRSSKSDDAPINLKETMAAFQAHARAVVKESGLTQAHLDALAVDAPELQSLISGDFADLNAVVAELDQKPEVAEAPAVKAAAAEVAAPSPAANAVSSLGTSKLTREDVIARHAQKQGFAAEDLSGLDLSGLDLAGADFSGALLDKTSFKGGRLVAANFSNALVKDGDFSGADLKGADLMGTSAGGASFSGALLHGAHAAQGDFTGADFSQAQLLTANLAGAIFDQAKMSGVQAAGCTAPHASFAGCDLAGADFGQATLKAASFSGASLLNASFKKTVADNADFSGADARAADFGGASLKASRADAGSQFAGGLFNGSDLQRASWGGAMLGKAAMTGANLDNADFSGVQAADAHFGSASAKGTRFDKADLRGANLTGINLFKGSLRKSVLDGAALRNANFYGVDFYGASPTTFSLQGSNIDQTLLAARPPLV